MKKEIYIIYLENKVQILFNRLNNDDDIFVKSEIENELSNIEKRIRNLADKINMDLLASKIKTE